MSGYGTVTLTGYSLELVSLQAIWTSVSSLSFIFFSPPFHAGHVRSPSPRPGPGRCDDDSLSAFSFFSFFFCSFFPLLKHKKMALLPAADLGISLLLLTVYLRHSLGIPLSSCHPRQGGAWRRTQSGLVTETPVIVI